MLQIAENYEADGDELDHVLDQATARQGAAAYDDALRLRVETESRVAPPPPP